MAPGRDRTRATLLGGECSHHCLIAASRRLLETTERMSQQERKYCPCSCFGMLKLFNETGSHLLLYQLTHAVKLLMMAVQITRGSLFDAPIHF